MAKLGVWAERVCVLVEFPAPDAEQWVMRCEALPATAANAPENWQPVFGWTARAVASVSATPKAKAKPQPKAKPKPKPQPAPATVVSIAARKRAFEALYAKGRTCELHGKHMGSVSDFLVNLDTPAAKRKKPTLGEHMPRWATRFQWPPRSWLRTPRFSSSTGGGRDGIAATKAALEDIHQVLCQ